MYMKTCIHIYIYIYSLLLVERASPWPGHGCLRRLRHLLALGLALRLQRLHRLLRIRLGLRLGLGLNLFQFHFRIEGALASLLKLDAELIQVAPRHHGHPRTARRCVALQALQFQRTLVGTNVANDSLHERSGGNLTEKSKHIHYEHGSKGIH